MKSMNFAGPMKFMSRCTQKIADQILKNSDRRIMNLQDSKLTNGLHKLNKQIKQNKGRLLKLLDQKHKR